MGFCERDSDDRYRADDGHRDVEYRDLPPSGHDPEDVEDERKTTAVSHQLDISAEGTERNPGHLEQLHTERNADDGQAHKEAEERVIQCNQKASEEEPQNISKCVHRWKNSIV